ncbi:hypothetical protein PENTCL1PPCAC_513, partial [Pristionchus entomophagus]
IGYTHPNSASTKQFLTSKNRETAIKSSQLLRAIHHVCPATKGALEEFVMDNRRKFARIEVLI